MLPEELIQAIVSCLLEPEGRAEQAWLLDPTKHNPLHATGYALSLVSRRFLPHGRRVLYTTILLHRETTDERETARNFLPRIDHLHQHPHLAAFVRSCSFQISHSSSVTDATGVKELVGLCPHLDAFHLFERSYDDREQTEADLEAEEDRREVVRTIALAGLDSARLRLRHLTLTSGILGWAVVYSFLIQCTNLHTLHLHSVNPLRPNAELPSPLLPDHFPKLITIELNHSNDRLTSALILASPALKSFFWRASQATVPKLVQPHPQVTSFTCEVVAEPLSSDEHLQSLSAITSSFPSLTSLNFLHITTIPPSAAAASAFIGALPTTVASLVFLGKSIVPLSFALTPYLSDPDRTTLPALKSFSPFWGTLAKIPRKDWEPLVRACEDVGVAMGGSALLWWAKEVERKTERLRREFVEMEDQEEELWERLSAKGRTDRGWDPDRRPVRQSERWDAIFLPSDDEDGEGEDGK